MKYYWKSSSIHGLYNRKSDLFNAKYLAFENAKTHIFDMLDRDTEWCDVEENDLIKCELKFSPDKITISIDSVEVVYEIIEVPEQINVYGHEWEVIPDFNPKSSEHNWLVGSFTGVGDLWMNNLDGYMVLMERDGRIIKTTI